MPSPLIQSLGAKRRLGPVLLVLFGIATSLMAGCSWVPPFLSPNFSWTYKIDIQQGVVVTQEMAAQLKPGMTPDQVKFVMGSPPLIDPFHAERWDYPYVFIPGRGPREERRFTVYFQNGHMTRAEGDPLPTEKEFVASRIRINATEAKPLPEGDDKKYAPKPGTGEDSGAAPAEPASTGAGTSPGNGGTSGSSSNSDSSPSLWQRLTGWFSGSSGKSTAAPDSSPPPAPPAPASSSGSGDSH
ncbi:MAG: outer membrane protein assembly factor BamE [Burkholderiaceae bacterium]|jgi:outer membrane protein assembly factor BamE